MRHNKTVNHLSRKSAHRGAMLSNMATSLIMHKRIATTLAKAKALRKYVEPLITRSKEDSTQSRRLVFSYLQSKDAVTELFRDVAVKVADRPGGYTRILKTGNRIGDNAEMCIIELVDFNEAMLGTKETKAKAKATTRRSRAAGKKKEEAEPTAKVKTKKEPKQEVVETPEEPIDEAKNEPEETAQEPEEEKKD
jgi:large subunit ribosomal protein L17